MEIKMSTLNQTYTTLVKLTNRRFPAKTSYKLAKLIAAMEPERTIYQEQFARLINEYSEKDEQGAPKQSEDGQSVLIKPEHLETFEQEYNDLINIDVILPDIHFDLAEFDDCDFTPIEIYALDSFITE